LNCCDKELAATIQDHILQQSDYYTPEIDRNGVMALHITLQHITATNSQMICHLTNRLCQLDVRKIPGENISVYVKQCQALLNRIPFSEKRSMEFSDAITRTMLKCSVSLFVTSIQSYVAMNEILQRTISHNKLLKYAQEKYLSMVNNGDWLQTTKSKTPS
jgi:hypothetical protein